MITKRITEYFLWMKNSFNVEVPRFKIVDATPTKSNKLVKSHMIMHRHDGLRLSMLTLNFEGQDTYESMVTINGINSCPVNHDSFNDMINYAIEIGNSKGIPSENNQ